MKKGVKQQLASIDVVPKLVAEMPQRERESMQLARKQGVFDGKAHLAKSPIGRAMAHGFPIAAR